MQNPFRKWFRRKIRSGLPDYNCFRRMPVGSYAVIGKQDAPAGRGHQASELFKNLREKGIASRISFLGSGRVLDSNELHSQADECKQESREPLLPKDGGLPPAYVLIGGLPPQPGFGSKRARHRNRFVPDITVNTSRRWPAIHGSSLPITASPENSYG